DDYLANFLRQTGPAMSPFNAWLLLKALETLPLRIDAHVEGAELLAAALSAHPKLAKLIYPFHKDHPQFALAKKQMSGGGSLIALQIKGGKKEAFALQNQLKIACISNNLGDAKTLITHPATTTHQRLSPQARAEIGVSDSLLRISVGLEDPADLIDDFNQALDKL
ncbi:MAG: PLP-dependent transferase, partial [Alphaproteobacteria bacterium]|nr:PLP-dependent transferase [Alphaproteobacteria bacterium]